ncbi:MAG: hypothetical protein K1W35_26045 [Lachnospiraceae bacterium]
MTAKEKMQMKLFTNLEPYMMCMGAAIASFIGKIYYSLDAPSYLITPKRRQCW